ncbi:hypothetical protein [Salinimicrobium xinjiangense]|uniref:hypothetical protein n=1 Tax=Salinimicrobium xinjiangense TaxID=438596 RepID=UPI00040B2A80|nr:hypothetical protein [Salinimicrobium xinjiangense]
MKIFQEKQFVKRWWLLMFMLAIIVIVVGTAYYATLKAHEDTAVIVSLISLAITMPVVFALAYLRLETRIDKTGITTQFQPFGFTKKFFNWSEIEKCHVRKVNARKEYGGWGIRGLGTMDKAYHIYGTDGIQIKTYNSGNFLIGTQRPRAAEDIINLYRKT